MNLSAYFAFNEYPIILKVLFNSEFGDQTSVVVSEKQFKYQTAAMGGTFDHIHKGHRLLLQRAFETADYVIIGLTSNDFARSSGKVILHDFDDRKARLERYLNQKYPGRKYKITKLETRFGPAIFTKSIEALIVSEETFPTVQIANEKRREMGLPDLKAEVVPMVLAEDSDRISSTRIRAGEIDTEGKILRSKNPQHK